MLPKSILWKQSYCIWTDRHEEAILLFAILQMCLTHYKLLFTGISTIILLT